MKFQVPQFIETETKLIGPFTLKQFLWLAGGGALITLSYMILPQFIFFVVAFPIGLLAGLLAFVKIDGIPLLNYLTYMLAYALNPKKYLFDESGGDEGNNDIVKINSNAK